MTLRGSAYSGAEVTVTTKPKKGQGKALNYSFRLKSWFINSGGIALNWNDAKNYCAKHQNLGYRLPDRSQLINAPDNIIDFVGTRGTLGALWSEWGRMANYSN